jgi:predicted nucleic acid-binding protein
MIKAVIDTNVVVSAKLVDPGPSAAIFNLAVNQKLLEQSEPKSPRPARGASPN